ncbi:ImmA/IrrE family metallo-endopeptidase [Patescibacteria group bacterium]|nr:ImmA/IrrE family metallo-endopeptidase [Patescibacteria group bacterium]MBU4580686.1 ImmA/IrrE family metallo-endopeptidase [Patescibacteria group bacterium]
MKKVDFINKDSLRIARENVGMATFFVSRKFSKSENDLVLSWEKGESLPTWTQVNKLSKIYNVPDLAFFSEHLIKKNKTIPDYRVSQGVEDSERVKKLVNLVIRRQEWLEQKLKDEGVKNTVQGSGKHLQTPVQLALFVKEKLDIDLNEIKRISGVDARRKVLKYLIEKAENCGIFIGKTISYHKIDVDEMRGLFVSNDYCPFIILNRRDSLSAQIFSFAHELAHLFRKTEAISNSLDFRKLNSGLNDEEIFCNRVAVELLLPRNDFSKTYYDKVDIDKFSETYKVSTLSIFYRLKDLNKIHVGESDNLENEIKNEFEKNLKNMRKKKGGNHVNNMKDSNGFLFNKLVSKFYFENKIGYTEASSLLNFSVEHLW